jgi:hypothetical protein
LSDWSKQTDAPSISARWDGANGCDFISAAWDGHWDEERVLDRYELLYEAGLDRRGAARRHANRLRSCAQEAAVPW